MNGKQQRKTIPHVWHSPSIDAVIMLMKQLVVHSEPKTYPNFFFFFEREREIIIKKPVHFIRVKE